MRSSLTWDAAKEGVVSLCRGLLFDSAPLILAFSLGSDERWSDYTAYTTWTLPVMRAATCREGVYDHQAVAINDLITTRPIPLAAYHHLRWSV